VRAERLQRLATQVIRFDGTHLDMPHDDIEALRRIVGDARVVALGENTHGTRDFFEMKARMLRFLVEEMGFDALAMEATWPEANRLDEYVRHGIGDAAALLSGLYFWTWRTESVLEMIEWMREHNAAGGDVGFYGFDMQYPGMAMWNVQRYVEVVDADVAGDVARLYACLAPHANGPNGFVPGREHYELLAAETRERCNASIRQVGELLEARRGAYLARSTPDEFALAARSARVVEQFAEGAAEPGSRDAAMAENAIWLQERLGDDARLVLWAHNLHVANRASAMGSDLRAHYGDDLVIVGFTHGTGTFTARGPASFDPYTHQLTMIFPGSYEEYFSELGIPRFILDFRGRDYSGLSPDAWLWSRYSRAIGSGYDGGHAEGFWAVQDLPWMYDVIVHVQTTRATTLLPRTWPATFTGS
jgi:erythromycin esterase